MSNLSSCCQKVISLKLMPEYGSTYLWCNHCNCGIANFKKEFPNLPNNLIQTLELWCLIWDYENSGERKINKKHADWFKDTFIDSGRFLCEEINKYYPCYFEEDDFVLFCDLD